MVVSLTYIRIVRAKNMLYRLCDYYYMILIIFKVLSNIETHLTLMNRFKYISMPQTTGKKIFKKPKLLSFYDNRIKTPLWYKLLEQNQTRSRSTIFMWMVYVSRKFNQILKKTKEHIFF